MVADIASGVTLRPVHLDDLDSFFENESDTGAVHMAAFTSEDPSDRSAFDAHWKRILDSETVVMRTIVVRGEVAGSIGSYASEVGREVTYWVGQPFWGFGVATEALRLFLEIEARRPMHARVATDNLRSISVLKSNGFSILRTDEGFAHGRGEIVAEYVVSLAS